MKKKKTKIIDLVPGQGVKSRDIWKIGKVIRMTAQDMYLVDFDGNQVEVSRRDLAVLWSGQWVFGEYNASPLGDWIVNPTLTPIQK